MGSDFKKPKASGIAVWLGTAYAYAGELTVMSTEAQLPCLWGALTSTFSSAIYSVIITYIKVHIHRDPPAPSLSTIPAFTIATNAHAPYQPQNFDWRVFLLLNEVKDSDSETYSSTGPEATNRIADIQDLNSIQHPYPQEELNRMKRAGLIASVFSVIVGLVTWVVWPLPLYRDYIFTKSFFSGWTIVSEIWLFFCLLVASVYPIVDGRDVLLKAARLAWQSITAKGEGQSQTEERKGAQDQSSSSGVDDEGNEKGPSGVEDKSKNIDVVSVS
ncbi:hypothetical protein DTO271G3_4086 [Paecilomyces variotii]|nr:hypothetical protein DTO271G3_4086 [Paecilomyces variotii]